MSEPNINLENVKILNHLGLEAQKAIFLLNGGASIAFLTFIGTIAIKGTESQIVVSSLAPVLAWFAVGAGLSVLSLGLNYLIILAQIFGFGRLGAIIRFATISVASISIIFFFIGVWKAIAVFS